MVEFSRREVAIGGLSAVAAAAFLAKSTERSKSPKMNVIADISLGLWPTPIHPLENLSDHLGGPRIWMKRDDCSGLAHGGNKTRKLEYLMAEAVEAKAGTIITVGGVQSNHACQTAAAAAKLGLTCHLVLARVVSGQSDEYETAGNIPAEMLYGAHVHLVDDEETAATLITSLFQKAEEDGRPAYFIPAGGSTTTGTLGFVQAALELKRQEDERGKTFSRVVLATSTAGSLAGLAAGFAMCNAERPLDAMMVYKTSDHIEPITKNLIQEVVERLGSPQPDTTHIFYHDDCLGDGYGITDEKVRSAVTLVAQKEGVLIDPVYTGKAMAGLIDLIEKQKISIGEDVLFWHTGGAAALTAYPNITAHL